MFLSRPQPARNVFFSLRLADASAVYLASCAPALHRAIKAVRQERPFDIDSIVVLPNALHTIWALPPGDFALNSRIDLLQRTFARDVAPVIGLDAAQVWEDHLVPHIIGEDDDLDGWRTLIHSIPVPHTPHRATQWRSAPHHRLAQVG